MHGLGNDFMVIDNISQSIELTAAQICSLAARNTGIGFDQLLIVAPPSSSEVDFDYQIYNSDGSSSGQCGNGARCFALFVKLHNLSAKTQLCVQTATGIMTTSIHADNKISVNMGAANWQPSIIPFAADVNAKQLKEAVYNLNIGESEYPLSVVSVGNPHAVLKVEELDNFDLETVGRELQESSTFPEQVNVGAMQIIDEHTIKLRVYERGAGETLACGSGACAAAVAACAHYGLAENISVQMRGGNLAINYALDTDEIVMSGSATYVFDGNITLDGAVASKCSAR